MSITKPLISTFSLIAIVCFCTASFAASKDIVTGDIKQSNAKTTVIAKAPTNTNFKLLDTNADGKVSLQESIKESKLAENFNTTDVNHDGVITVDEYAMYKSANDEQTTVN